MVEEGVENRVDFGAGDAEDVFHAGFVQALDEEDGDFHWRVEGGLRHLGDNVNVVS